MRHKKDSHDLPQRSDNDPNSPTRHKGFQFGTNPMQEDSFEKRLIRQDLIDRQRVRNEQVMGMQGRDGGAECYDKAKSLAKLQVTINEMIGCEY